MTGSSRLATPQATLSVPTTTVSNSSRSTPGSVPRLLREGEGAHGGAMVVRGLPSRDTEPRHAVIASRKIGGAVTRNRAKRRLREALRAAALPQRIDFVVIARAAALTTPLPQLRDEVEALCGRVADRLARNAGAPGA